MRLRFALEGLTPAVPADKRVLLRRATFDLNGLPPTEAEIEAFLADRSPQAFARVVDRLLASPRYGEHLLGLDHEKLMYFHGGRNYRLTDVHGQVAHKIPT